MPQTVTLSPSSITRVIASAIGLLIVAHVAGLALKFGAGYETAYGFVPLFDLNHEQSIPTFFAALLLLFAGVLLSVIAVLKRRAKAPFSAHWTVLACGFVLMACDEAAGLHELLGRLGEALLGDRAGGYFYFAWVLPGMLIVLTLAVVFLRFFLHLPRSTRVLVFAGAALFLGGAIGVELFEGRHTDMHGPDNLTYGLWVLLEESLEMAGIAVFVHAMLRYIEQSYGSLSLRLGHPERTAGE